MGVVIDVIATLVILSVYYSTFIDPGASKWAAFGDEAAAYWKSEDGLLATLLIGCLGTLIGGFYAAFKAGTQEKKHGALVGLGSIILGLVLQGGSEDGSLPEWFVALSAAAAIPAGALGGFFAEMLNDRLRHSTSSPGGPRAI